MRTSNAVMLPRRRSEMSRSSDCRRSKADRPCSPTPPEYFSAETSIRLYGSDSVLPEEDTVAAHKLRSFGEGSPGTWPETRPLKRDQEGRKCAGTRGGTRTLTP